MSFRNFVPIAYAQKILKELETDLVNYEDMNHDYEGQAKEQGDTIKILNAGKPTLETYGDGKLHALNEPEEIQGSSILLPIRQVAQFNFAVGDIDKAIAKGNLYETYMTETKEEIASKQDAYMASLIAHKNIKGIKKTTAVDKTNVLDYLDETLLTLKENDVNKNMQVVVTASPKFVDILRKAYRELDTNNSELLKNGYVGKYNSMIIKESNHNFKSGDYEYVQVKTRRAIAFVKPYIHLEPYRIEKHFKDAVKGYAIYDGIPVRPKEALSLQVKY